LTADFIKRWDNERGATQQQLSRATTYLDNDTPVALGAWWPRKWSTTKMFGVDLMVTPSMKKSGEQEIMFDGHSTVLVGYRSDKDFPGGGYFVFRNSSGERWGDGGYGYMSYDYVLRYGNDLLTYR
jgi:C1A family cysteine protease